MRKIQVKTGEPIQSTRRIDDALWRWNSGVVVDMVAGGEDWVGRDVCRRSPSEGTEQVGFDCA